MSPFPGVVTALARNPWVVTTLLVMTVFAVVRVVDPHSAVLRTVHDSPLILLALAAVLDRARRCAAGRQRTFWLLLALALGHWLAVRFWELGPGRPTSWEPATALIRDLIYLGFYGCIVFALELRPDMRLDRGAQYFLQGIRTAAGTTVVIGLLLYLAVLPAALTPEAYAARVPSYLYYSILDAYVLALLMLRLRQARGSGWRAVYAALAAAAAFWLISDGASGLVYLGVAPEALIGPVGVISLQFDFLAVVVASRVVELARTPSDDPVLVSLRLKSAPFRSLWAGPLVAYLIALPLLHFGFSISGFVDPRTRPAREVLLVAVLLILALFTWLHERLLGAENRRLESEALARRREAQRLAALGQLSAGIAHDFNNLMTVIGASSEFVRQELAPESALRSDLDEIDHTLARGAEMVRRLLAFGRQQPAGAQSVDLHALLLEISRSLRRLLPESIQVDLESRPLSRPVAIGAAAVEQILLNFATNARDAMPAGGRLLLRLDEREIDAAVCARQGWGQPGNYAVLTVVDTGAGMTDEIRERLFEPYFTTKPEGRGTGLGLTMVADLVRLSRGNIEIESSPGGGTTVRTFLPLLREDGEVGHSAVAPVSVADRGTETILVVEDEPAIRRLAERALRSRGYRVLTAADGREGLELFRQHRDEIALVVTDVVMPHLSGPELVEAVRRLSDTPVILTTGYSEHEAGSALDPSVPRLLKPWPLDSLTAMVRSTLDRARSTS